MLRKEKEVEKQIKQKVSEELLRLRKENIEIKQKVSEELLRLIKENLETKR